jgi:hypothetical protein
MKRFCLLISFILAGMAAVAQDDVYGAGKKEPRPVEIDIQGIELTSEGAYERKEVVDVDGVNAAVLYDRAMMALSDWTGPDGKAKAGIDYQNQETHTVIYKGTFSLGFKNVFLGDGWNRYANFTVKVRCKDGRAQVTVTVAQMTVIYNRGNLERSYTIGKVLDAVKKSKGDKRKRGEMLMADIVETADGMIAAMGVKLKAAADSDDDF